MDVSTLGNIAIRWNVHPCDQVTFVHLLPNIDGDKTLITGIDERFDTPVHRDRLASRPGNHQTNALSSVEDVRQMRNAGTSSYVVHLRSFAAATLILSASIGLWRPVPAAAQDATDAAADRAFGSVVQPLLKRFCFECHSGDCTEAEIDLAASGTIADVRKQLETWVKVRVMLDTAQMPPKDSLQLTDGERQQLQKWVRDFLTREAEATAGDPGPVLLRRLNNEEYNYTVRDLTEVMSLDPTREFPVDGAAGEGFINTGAAQGMSPSLVTKYLDAAKDVARHAVLLPDRITFSPHVTRRDHTDAWMTRIRDFYRPFGSDSDNGEVPRSGSPGDPVEGARFLVEPYLSAMLVERESLQDGSITLDQVARKHDLNGRYLASLYDALTASPATPSPVLDRIRARWQEAGPDDLPALVAEVTGWQAILWKFNPIGHIGRAGGPKKWMEAVNPLASQRDFELKLPDATAGEVITMRLLTSDAGDGKQHDLVIWENPRLVGDGPDVPLGSMQGLRKRIAGLKEEMLKRTAVYLEAVAEAGAGDPDSPPPDLGKLAEKHQIDAAALKAWLDYLAIRVSEPVQVKGHFTKKMLKSSNYDFINGWGTHETPSVSANSSDQEVRIPGIARPHSVIAHPSPTLFAAIGWQSPLNGEVRVEARLADAHPECGNGQEWFIQHRTVHEVTNLGQGHFVTRGSVTMPFRTIIVRKGDLVSLILGPRAGNHGCDLTEVNLMVTETSGTKRSWDLAGDVSGNILTADRHGNEGIWHFYKGPMNSVDKNSRQPISIPAGSLLAEWLLEKDAVRKTQLAKNVQALVTTDPPADNASANSKLYEQIHGLTLAPGDPSLLAGVKADDRFGKHPLGHEVKSTDLVVQAPVISSFHIPAQFAAGRTLVVSGRLDPEHGREGSVKLEVASSEMKLDDILPSSPIIVQDGSGARKRIEKALDEFRQIFPASLCYSRIVPIDRVVTLTLFYREDDHLQRMMLDDDQVATLNQLWDELLYVSQEPLKYQVAFEQIREFATQDRPDLVKEWEVLVESVNARTEAFRQRLVKDEPIHLDAVLQFAGRAWRQPLSETEISKLRGLYGQLRESGLSHEDSIRLMLARIMTSPAFLYRLEQPAAGEKAAPISDLELATRLSYFFWSSLPDEPLLAAARSGQLAKSEAELQRQTARMLADPRTRRMAVQFACQWLHLRGFDENDDKNEKLYPEFASLRSDMYEETVLFFTDMFRNDGSILDLLDADHAFLNERLARHYGIDGVSGPAWRRVENVRAQGRGGLLGMATFLSSQSGASRTSPILRGNWVYETLLGERLPRPPANVPVLPEVVPSGQTARQLIELHSSVPACAKCHAKIDFYGFALEQYDAIGRLRASDVDTTTKLVDGRTIEGINGLRDYLLTERRIDVVRQFCRKLLGFALGREVQLSDELLLTDMRRKLEANDYRFSLAVETIVTSRQFRQIRGAGFADASGG